MKIKNHIRVTAIFLAVCTVLLMLPLSVRADEYWPDGVKTQSKSAIVMEVNTGTVLYEKKSHEKHYPASITKIMTVLLAIENCDMDEVVTFSADAVFKNEGDTSHIARNLGEKLTMEQCLYAVMLESANECAYAVAEHVGQKLGGDYRTFIDHECEKESLCNDSRRPPRQGHCGERAAGAEHLGRICGTGTQRTLRRRKNDYGSNQNPGIPNL